MIHAAVQQILNERRDIFMRSQKFFGIFVALHLQTHYIARDSRKAPLQETDDAP